MKLSTARLCLDCEEIHDAQVCPVCTSETFAFLTRWVPEPEPSKQRAQPNSSEAEIYRRLITSPTPSQRGRLFKQGLIGLTAVGMFGWMWRTSGRAGRKEAEGRSPRH
jgi:hypothetical protein